MTTVARRPAWLRRARDAWIALAPSTFARWCRPDDHELGRLGEELAARALRRAGLVLLGRRVRTRHAEVDCLAREDDDLVCIEIKTSRTLALPRPRGAVAQPHPTAGFGAQGRLGALQTARLQRAARHLAQERGLRPRVDRVDVRIAADGRSVDCRHVRGLAATRKRVPDWARPRFADHD